MSAGAYELLALAMRYVFALLMLLIVARAWRITAIDSARARRLRRLSPETGVIGEMLVVDGGERARPGMRYPVTLEGAIGSGRRADIRLRHSSVRRLHAYYQMTEKGLYVRGHASARVRDGVGALRRELTLGDGDELSVGRVRLMLVLTEGGAAPDEIRRRVPRRRRAAQGGADEPFEPDERFEPDALFFPDGFDSEEDEDGGWDERSARRRDWDERRAHGRSAHILGWDERDWDGRD